MEQRQFDGKMHTCTHKKSKNIKSSKGGRLNKLCGKTRQTSGIKAKKEQYLFCCDAHNFQKEVLSYVPHCLERYFSVLFGTKSIILLNFTGIIVETVEGFLAKCKIPKKCWKKKLKENG